MPDAQQAQSSPEPNATPAEPQPSNLDKVYQEYGIEDDAATFEPKPSATPQPSDPVAPRVPDPFDPGFQDYQRSVSTNMAALTQAMSATQGQLTAMQQNMVRERNEVDIRQAVSKISEKSKIDPDIVEVALEAQARKDPKLLKVWNNRTKNPKALEAALNALSDEFQQKFVVRQDPQLVENQRAVAASRNQMATTARQTSQQDEYANMTPQERQAKVQQLIRSGG